MIFLIPTSIYIRLVIADGKKMSEYTTLTNIILTSKIAMFLFRAQFNPDIKIGI